MTSSRIIIRNTTALFIIQVASHLLPFVTVPYLTRTLGVEGYGIYAYALGIVGFATVLTDFGFNLWATAEVSKYQNNKHAVNRLFGAVTVAQIFLMLICILIVIFFSVANNLGEEYRNVFYWTVIPIIGIVLQPVWLFYGLERMHHVTFFTLISRLTFLYLVFTFINNKNDLVLLIIILGLTQIFAASMAWFLLIKSGYFPVSPTLIDCYKVLKKSFPFFLSRVAVLTYTTGGAIFLGMVSTAKNVAIYSVAEQIYRGIQALLSPLSQVMFPYMIRTRNYLLLIKLIIVTTMLVMGGSFFGIYYFGEIVISILYGVEYKPALEILNIFLIILIINTPSVLLGYPMLGAFGKLNIANNSVLFASLVYIIIIVALYTLEKITVYSVTMTILIAEIIVLLIRLICYLRTNKC